MLKHSSTFFSVFPPPKLLIVQAAGLHISDTIIRAVISLSKNGDYINCAERPLPPGTVEGGAVQNENVLAQELKALKEQLGLSFVRVSLPEERAYLFTIDIPAEGDTHNYIETKLEENIPISPKEVIFEYDTYEHKASVYAVPEKIINSYVSCCTLAGLTVVSLDTESHALIQALSPKGPSVIVYITETSTSMVIAVDGIGHFSSTISVGSNDLAQAIAKSPEDVFAAALNTLSVIRSEVEKVVTYWNTHGENKKIENIYIVGHDSGIPGMVEYFSSQFKINVLVGNIWGNYPHIHTVSKLDPAKALDYGVVLGLTMQK